MTTVSVPDADSREVLAAALGEGGGDARDIEIVVWDGFGDAPAEASRIVLFTGKYNCAPPPRETFEEMRGLRVIQLVSAGVEPWLPVVPDGVVLCNGRGIHGGSTAELAVAGMLAVLRELPCFLDAQREHRSDRPETRSLVGRRLLVLGAGDIGRRIGGVGEILDAEVTYVARTARDGVHSFDELPDLLPEHDVVALALPLTAETEGIVDTGFLAAMPDGGVLVNVSRGRHVDTDALLAELTSRRLSAFLDVTDPEPLPADHPLWDAPNLVLTPHVGGGTAGWERRAYALVADQVRRLRDGGIDALRNRVGADY